MNEQRIKLFWHPKQGLFHFADEDEPIRKYFGWKYIGTIPENLACDFSDYADKNILNKNEIIPYEIMRDEFYKWVYKL